MHVFNWVSILSVCVTGGREDLVLTEIPRYYAGNQPGRIASLIRRTNRHVLIATLLVGCVFMSVVQLFAIPTLHEYRTEFLIAWGAVFFSAYLSLNQSILQSLNFIRLCQVVDKLIRPALLATFFATAMLLHSFAGTRLLILLAEASLGICAVFLALIMRNKTRIYFRAVREVVGDGFTRKTFYFFLITLMTLLVTKITMLVLPFFAPRAEIGIFNISSRFADLVIYPFYLMHNVLPQLFARHATSDPAQKQSLYRSATRLMAALALPLLLFNLLAGKFLLGLFGQPFRGGYAALVLLSFSQFLYSLSGPANTVLMMQNREAYAVLCLLAYVVLLTAASFWLVPIWGITGGAAAVLGSCLIYNTMLAACAYRLNGVMSPFFAFLVRWRR